MFYTLKFITSKMYYQYTILVKIKKLLILVVLIGITGSAINSAWATMEVVEAGFDLFMTTQLTEVDLSGFGLGVVPLEGDESFFGFPGTDTIVERLAPAGVPNVGDSNTIPIELVALSLVSVSPVTIELIEFDLHVVGGSLELSQFQGSMTINRDDPNGGSFSATLPVDAVIHFLEVGGIGTNDFTVPFDDVFTSTGVWSHTPAFFSCFIPGFAAGGFFPGVDPITMAKVPTFEEAAFAKHTVVPCMIPTPTNGGVGGEYFTLDTTALLLAGVQTNLAWIIPVAVSTVGIGAFLLRKKF